MTITPYALRHSFALSFVRNGGDAFALQEMMGHSDMNMTRVYVDQRRPLTQAFCCLATEHPASEGRRGCAENLALGDYRHIAES